MDEWSLGQGFRSASNEESDTDGQQAGEVEFKGESLLGGNGPGWAQSRTPGSAPSRSGRKIGVRVDVNGLGGGIKSKRYPNGQAVSNALNRGTGHGDPVAENDDDGSDYTLDEVAPPSGHSDEKPGYGKPRRAS